MMEPILLTLEAGGSTYLDVPHEGEEFGYVLHGSIQIHVGRKVHTAKKWGIFLLYSPFGTLYNSKQNKRCKDYMGDNPTEFLIQGGFYMARKLIDISHISKSYGYNLVLDDLNLYINENKFFNTVGTKRLRKDYTAPYSGRFETPDNGKIYF